MGDHLGHPHPAPHTLTLLPENSIPVTRGSSKILRVTVTDANSRVVDLTGATIVMTVKENTTDINPLIYKTSAHGTQAAITLPRTGIAEIYLVPADTQNLAVKQYLFDVWVILSSGKRHQVVKPSTFDLQPSVSSIAL